MRRSACLLTIVGLSLNTVAAQDVFGPGKLQSKPSRTSLQFYGAGSSNREAERYERSTPAAAPAESVPNYYNELFAEKPAAEEATTRLKPAGTAQEQQKIIQAEFQADPANQQPVIQQVRATGSGARPFPGQMTPVTDQVEISKPVTSRLTMVKGAPVAAPETPAVKVESSETIAPAEEAPSTGGSVTFSSRPDSFNTLGAPTVATPATGPQTPSVTIEWRPLSSINVGQECECDLLVKNAGTSDATGVEVEATFPRNVRLVDSSPKPTRSETFLGWDFPVLKAGEERVIRIKMVPLERGNIATRANVRFTGSASGLFTVAEPLLAVSVKGPQQVMVGESAPQTIVVTNPGNGVTSNVQIEAVIPEGLEHARGRRLVMEIGSLNPGESRNVRLAMIAVAGGQHQVQVQARADSGLLQNAKSDVVVVAPQLTAAIDGPGLRYLGRQGRFKLKVANDGAAATSNVQVMHKIPDGFEFVGADRGVQFDKASGLMTWFVGRLEKGQTSEINVSLLAKEIGEHKHLVRATSEHGSISDAEFTTRVEGTSSLSLQVVDLDDPVELGTEAIYEVRIKNEGSAAAKDVGLACEMTQGVNFVSAEGPSEHIAENGTVVFRTMPELGPGKTATFRVKVSSTTTGNTRFRARMISESIAEPLTADELTRFYGE